MNFDQLRQKYPGYSDEEILQGLQATRYPEYSVEEIKAAVGYKPRTRNLAAVANDLVIEGANAAAGGVSAAASFVSPGNRVSRFIDENIVRAGEEKQSDFAKDAKARMRTGIDQAQGVGDELAAVGRYVVDAPGLTAAQAVGSFVGPGAAVKGGSILARAAGAGARGAARGGMAGGAVAGGAMAGGDAAQTAYELVIKAGGTEEQAQEAARQASAIPAVIGASGGFVGAERLLAGAGGAAGGAARRALVTGGAEALQEGIEEGATQFEGQRAAAKYDPTIDPTKGVAAAAGLGAVLGGVTGAGVSLISPHEAQRADATRRLAEAGSVDEAIQAANDLASPPRILQRAGLTAGQEARAMGVMEGQASDDLAGIRQQGRMDPTGLPPRPPQPERKGSAEFVDSPLADRILTVRDQLADEGVRGAIRALRPELLDEAMYYVNMADNPQADLPAAERMPEATRDRLLAVAETIIQRATLKEMDRAKPLGSRAFTGPAQLAANAAPPQIGLDTGSTGNIRVDSAGQAAPETRADAINTAQRVDAMRRGGRTGNGMEGSVPRGQTRGAGPGVMVGEGTATPAPRPERPARPLSLLEAARGARENDGREQPDLSGTPGVAAAADVGRGDQPGGSRGDVGLVAPDATGRVPAPAEAPAGRGEPAQPVGEGVKPDETLSDLQRQWQEAAQRGDSMAARTINERIVALKARTLKRQDIDAAAAEAATSPKNDRPEPTDAQKEAGNYKKGHVRISGLDVTIENDLGSTRRSKADAPKRWEVKMPYHYGYIKRTTGSDGDHVDIGIGPKGENGRFWIINQHHDGKPDAFDEHKVFTGVDSADEAVALYKRGFADNFGDRVFSSISAELSADELKAKLPELKKAQPEPAEKPSLRERVERVRKPKGGVKPAAGRNVMPEGLFVTFGGKTFKVDSVEDAQRKWIAFRDEAGGGVSEVGNGVRVTDGAGRFVARISYNGRVWDIEDSDPRASTATPIAEAPDTRPPLVERVESIRKKPAEQAPAAPEATHKDPGEPAEPATPAVVKDAIRTAARNDGRPIKDVKADALRLIDEAIAKAPSSAEIDAQIGVSAVRTVMGKKTMTGSRGFGEGQSVVVEARETRDGKLSVTDESYDGSGTGRKKRTVLGELQGTPAVARDQLMTLLRRMRPDGTLAEPDMVTINVPGDGEFKVANTKERLAELRRKVEASPGFKTQRPGPTEPMRVNGYGTKQNPGSAFGVEEGSGSKAEAFANMVDDGDIQAALDYAEAVGIDPTKAKLTDVLRKRLDKWMADNKDRAPEPEAEATAPAPAAEKPKADRAEQRDRLEQVAERLGVKVFKAAGGWHASGDAVDIPDGDVDAVATGAVSANHVFAHELGHVVMQKRGLGFKNFPRAEVERYIPNWDEFIAASKEFRPGVHEHENERFRKHAKKPDEIIADAIASVLIGDRPVSMLKPMMDKLGITERDLGLVDKAAEPAAQPKAEEDDYIAKLFGTTEEQAAAQAKFTADAETKKQGIARIRDAIATEKKRAQAEHDDWAGRQYKANRTQVELKGDGPSNQPSMSIGAINESRRRNAMEALTQEINALGKLADAVLTDTGAEKVLANLRALMDKARAAVDSGNWPGSTLDGMFESMLLDDLKFRGPAGRGNVTSNGLSKAILAALKGADRGKAQEAQDAQEDGNQTARVDRGGGSDVAPVAAPQQQPEKAEKPAEFAPMPPVAGIPRDVAQRAHEGTSFTPEKRAGQEQESFMSALRDAWERAARAAGTDQAAIDRITEVFKDVADGYRTRYLATLGARSRVMSAMIAGPARFPTERNNKRIETEMKRAREAQEYLDRGIKRLMRAARGPIDNSPESELERVRLNLSQREELQETMKAANAALRKGDDEALRDLGFDDEQIAKLKKGDFSGRKGFPDYKLTNNNAEIRRLRERLKDAEARMQDAATGPAEREVAGVRVVEDATADRIRLYFNGKPSEEVRDALKTNGFRWSPKEGAWQRQLTDNARRAADAVLARMVVIEKPATENLSLADRVDAMRRPADTASDGQASDRHQQLAAEFQQRLQDRFPGALFHAVAAGPAAGSGSAGSGVSEASRERAAVSTIAKRLYGHEVVFVRFDSDKPLFNGAMSDAMPGVVFINADAQRPMMAVLGHELVHGMSANQKALYQILARRLSTLLKNEDQYIDLLNLKYTPEQRKGLKYGEELIADVVGDFFMEPQFWRDMAAEQPSLFKRVAQAIVRFLDDVIGKLTKARPFGTEQYLTDIEAARAAVVDAMRQFSGAEVGAMTSQSEGVNLSPGQRDVTTSPEFKRWFSDSKVVDVQGKPLVVYRGRDPKAGNVVRSPVAYFALNRSAAEDYAEQHRTGFYWDDDGAPAPQPLNVLEAYLSIKNPATEADIERIAAENDHTLTVDGRPAAYLENDAKLVRLLQDAGYDGAYGWDDRPDNGGEIRVWAAFRPEQIKSATGNRGTFDPASSDINLSIADTIDSVRNLDRQKIRDNLADLFGKAGAKVSWWDKSLGTQYAKAEKFPEFKRVFDKVQQYLEDTSTLANQAADLAPDILPKLETWRDLARSGISEADASAIAGPIYRGTLEDEKVYDDDELRSRFKLNEQQIGMYRQFREAVENSLDQAVAADVLRMLGDAPLPLRNLALNDRALLRDAVDEFLTEQIQTGPKESVTRMSQLRDDIRQKYERVDQLKAEGYAPLMRFGRYFVHVHDEQGGTTYFGLYESRADANSAARELAAAYPNERTEQGVLSQEQHKLFAGVPLESLEMFAQAIGAEDSEVFQQYIRLAKNNRSALKRLLHRKGTAGFSQDVSRSLAAFITSNARLASGGMNLASASDAAQQIRNGDVKDEAIKLIDVVKNPTETASWARSLLFMNFIGGSAASALVNLTQPITMTAPYLSQWGGVGKAALRLLAAGKAAASGKIGDPELRAALKRAEDDGIVSPQEIHHLQAEAMGTWGTNEYAKKAAFIWGSMFSLAEQFNRRVTFIAAYQTAKAQNLGDPFAFAEKAVVETQGLYNRANAPNWARNPVGATALTFKQFSIHYLEWMQRMAQSGPAGRKAVLVALAIMALTAGLQGLPFAEDLDDLVDTLAQALGYSTSARNWKREFIADTLGFGDVGADAAMRGLSAVPGVPLDVSMRMSMGNLLPATGVLLRSNTDRSRDVLELGGAAGSLAKQYLDAGQKALRGDFGGAAVAALPSAMQNIAKSIDILSTGEYRDTRDRKIMEADEMDALMKFVGFQPAEIARESRAVGDQMRRVQLVKNVEGEIAGKWAQGIRDKDSEKVREARAELAAWNRDNPADPISITTAQIVRRVRELGRSREERMVRSAPRELRGSVQEALQ